MIPLHCWEPTIPKDEYYAALKAGHDIGHEQVDRMRACVDKHNRMYRIMTLIAVAAFLFGFGAVLLMLALAGRFT